MSNPWLKKNPFMSLWLSGANKVAGAMRGHAAAQAKRQAAQTQRSAVTAMTQATKNMLSFWSGLPVSSTLAKTKKKRH